MTLKTLSLRGFRNYENLSASLVPGVNLIVGDNAQGKTNLLEAVAYLSTGRSFRTRREQELILRGADFADLEAVVRTREREQTARAENPVSSIWAGSSRKPPRNLPPYSERCCSAPTTC